MLITIDVRVGNLSIFSEILINNGAALLWLSRRTYTRTSIYEWRSAKLAVISLLTFN